MKESQSSQVVPSQEAEATESRFDTVRRQVGLLLGPAVFLLVLATPFEQLTPEAH